MAGVAAVIRSSSLYGVSLRWLSGTTTQRLAETPPQRLFRGSSCPVRTPTRLTHRDDHPDPDLPILACLTARD